jgi:RNA polymerase sigma-70 factor (ECF subfamily)
MTADEGPAEELLNRAEQGDEQARQELLGRYRERLRRLIAVRMDRRLGARVDPSDVVQEALIDAALKLPDYLRQRPLPFYPWLRRLAWERLLAHNRQHIYVQKRSVTREEERPPDLSDQSALELACRLVADGSSPSHRLQQQETVARIQAALARLPATDREVLVLRHLEQLSVSDMAAVLGITQGAVKVRHVRALKRFRALLAEELKEGPP